MEQEEKTLAEHFEDFKTWAHSLTAKLHAHGITHPLPGEVVPAETTEEETKQ